MATKSTGINGRLSALAQTANKGKEFAAKITEDTNILDMSMDDQKKVKYLSVDQIIEDPSNVLIYGSYEVKNMAENMKKYGFQGVVLVYPCGNNKYMIESGHRRYEAFKLSGLADAGQKLPCYITETPQTEYQRTLRLIQGNLHGRIMTPIIMSNVAETLIDAHGEEFATKALLKEISADYSQKDIIEAVSIDMEISVATVYKLRQFRSLIDPLKKLTELTDDEAALGLQEVSWTVLAGASVLSKESQERLCKLITDERFKNKFVTGAWVSAQIKRLKNPVIEKPIVEVSKNRRRNARKAISKYKDEMIDIMDRRKTFYSAEDKEMIKEDLLSIKEMIEKKLDELETDILF